MRTPFLGGPLRRAGWGIADQGLSSLTNFALNVAVARAVGATEFGAFGIAFATYLLALGLGRSWDTEPLTVRFSGTSWAQMEQAAKSATGAMLVVGVSGGLLCATAGLLMGGRAVGGAMVALGFSLPGLLLQDAWRQIFFAASRGRSAFINDLVWAIVLSGALVISIDRSIESAHWFIAAWGASATVAALVGMWQARFIPNPFTAVDWWKTHRDLGIRYVGEFLAMVGATQLVIYGTGLVVGLAAVGALRAAQAVLGPVQVLLQGIWLFALPDQVSRLRRSVERFREVALLLSVVLCGAALLVGAIAYMLPREVGESLFGETWAAARLVVIPMALALAGTGVSMGAVMGLRALLEAQKSLTIRLILLPLTLVSGVSGAALFGAAGAAVGLATSIWIGAVLWWIAFHRSLATARATREDSSRKVDISSLNPPK